MRITVLNLIVVIVFLLSGCAMKFPVPDETNQTILIIPVETRQTLGHFVFTLDLSIKGSSGNEGINHTVEPNPKILFSYNTKLKPGKYKIAKMVMQAKPGFKLGGGAKKRPFYRIARRGLGGLAPLASLRMRKSEKTIQCSASGGPW